MINYQRFAWRFHEGRFRFEICIKIVDEDFLGSFQFENQIDRLLRMNSEDSWRIEFEESFELDWVLRNVNSLTGTDKVPFGAGLETILERIKRIQSANANFLWWSCGLNKLLASAGFTASGRNLIISKSSAYSLFSIMQKTLGFIDSCFN